MSALNSVKFQKDKFIEQFLDPVSKVTDVTSFVVTEEGMLAIVNNDANIILFAKYPDVAIKQPTKINIQDIKKFIRLLECIDGNDVELEITSNTLNYKTSKLKFKYHFAEDALVPISKISASKINSLTFDSMFFVDRVKLQELLKASSVVSGCNKVYFTISKEEGVRAELTDYQQQQADSVGIHLTDEFEGKEITAPLPINLDVLRLIVGVKFEKMLVKINTELKVLMVEVQKDKTILKYIISSLVK
jgi:hypothetical protein